MSCTPDLVKLANQLPQTHNDTSKKKATKIMTLQPGQLCASSNKPCQLKSRPTNISENVIFAKILATGKMTAIN